MSYSLQVRSNSQIIGMLFIAPIKAEIQNKGNSNACGYPFPNSKDKSIKKRDGIRFQSELPAMIHFNWLNFALLAPFVNKYEQSGSHSGRSCFIYFLVVATPGPLQKQMVGIEEKARKSKRQRAALSRFGIRETTISIVVCASRLAMAGQWSINCAEKCPPEEFWWQHCCYWIASRNAR